MVLIKQIIVCFLLVAAPAAAIDCPATVVGSVEIYAVAYYLHEDPANIGYRYTYTTPTQVATNSVLTIQAEGFPVAIQWFARPYGIVTKSGYEPVVLCG